MGESFPKLKQRVASLFFVHARGGKGVDIKGVTHKEKQSKIRRTILLAPITQRTEGTGSPNCARFRFRKLVR